MTGNKSNDEAKYVRVSYKKQDGSGSINEFDNVQDAAIWLYKQFGYVPLLIGSADDLKETAKIEGQKITTEKALEALKRHRDLLVDATSYYERLHTVLNYVLDLEDTEGEEE